MSFYRGKFQEGDKVVCDSFPGAIGEVVETLNTDIGADDVPVVIREDGCDSVWYIHGAQLRKAE